MDDNKLNQNPLDGVNRPDTNVTQDDAGSIPQATGYEANAPYNQADSYDASQQYYGQAGGYDTGQQYGQAGGYGAGQQYGQTGGYDAGQQYYGQAGGYDAGQQYGQQPENPYYQQPGAVPPVNGGKKPKKPMSKGKKAGIIGGCIGGAAIIACGIIFIPKLFKSNKDRVADAFKATFNEEYMLEASPYEDVIGTAEIQQNLEEKGGEFHFGGELISIGGDTSAGGIGIEVSGTADNANDKSAVDIKITNDGTEAVDVQLFRESETMYITLKDILEGYLKIDEADIAAIPEMLQEMFFTYGYNGVVDSAENGITDSITDQAAEGIDNDASEALLEKIEEASGRLWKDADVEKEGSESIALGANTRKCTKYNIVFSEQSMEEALTDIMDAYSEFLSGQNTEISATDIETAMTQVKALIPTLVGGDFAVDIYVYDGKVVCVSAKDTVHILGTAIDYDMYLKLTGSDNIMSSFEAKLELNAAGSGISLNTSGSSEAVADGIETKLDVSLDMDGTSMAELKYDQKYNSSDSSITLNGSFVSGTESIEITGQGSYSDISKGSSFTLSLDDFTISSNGTEIIAFKLTCGASQLSKDVPAIDTSKPVITLTELSQDKIQSIRSNDQEVLNTFIRNVEALDEKLDLVSEKLNGLTDPDDGAPIGDDTEAVGDDWNDDDYEEPNTDYLNTVYTCDDGTTIGFKGMLPGFECTYASEYSFGFVNDSYCMLNYSYDEYSDMDELIESNADFIQEFYEDDISNIEKGITAKVDGIDIVYTKAEMTDNSLVYDIYRELPNGTIIYATFNAAPDNEDLTEEDILSCVSDSYIRIQ